MIAMELTINPLKGVIDKSAFNPHSRATQNYNIVEDMPQSPSSMSNLKVLQNRPTQKRI